MTSAQPTDKRPPVGVDPTRPSVARAYDYALGGKDNYEVDRQLVAMAAKVMPEVFDLAVENRAFLIRAVRFLATQTGINQYLDCGSGMPTTENTHQVVQRINPDARIVYIDNDPVVQAHGRALLEENDQTHFASADVFDPDEILANETVREHIDFSEPVALLHFGTLHHFPGERHRPAEIMKKYIDALPSGSFVTISHFFDPEDEYSEVARRTEQILHESPLGAGSFRTMAEIRELFHDLEMIDPGVTECVNWWPDGPQIKALNQAQHCIAGGIGRKL
ncbi:hypothetical protein CFN78_20255 [Amycolatopsis antarctica]|uniref:S-adenosyl methyltransferase n=1 Tax=Amycolatopsis antarctica TaxID=1854586 RepID=A0A263D1G8_9PSEU|nr:SAM-dependent methyltransferase [Amycolatopsis antarctica]OZM71477.1 hypothetical protein CFN78_20255 [Amycolatopsis antarctica]